MEFHLLARGLQCLGKLRLKQFAQLVHVRHALGAEHLRDLLHAFFRGIHADVEGDRDVRTDVVLAHEAVLALARDLQLLHRNIHQFHALENGQPQHPVKRHAHPANPNNDARLARLNFADAQNKNCREKEQRENDDGEGGVEHRRVG